MGLSLRISKAMHGIDNSFCTVSSAIPCLASPRTLCPRACKNLAMRLPKKPVIPVTRMFIINQYSIIKKYSIIPILP